MFTYFFVYTIFDYYGKKIDFQFDQSYYRYPTSIKLKSINNKIIPVSGFKDFWGLIPATFINNRLFVPPHNKSGNYEILADLTEYINGESFKSCELQISDPISANIIGKNDQLLLNYNREPKMEILSTYIKIINSNSILIGKITNLPDTTIILSDFYSNPYILGRMLNPPVLRDFVYIKECIIKLKRKKITLSMDDNQVVIVPISNAGADITVYEGSTVILDGSRSFDPEGDSITYKWTVPDQISLSSSIVVKPSFIAPKVFQDTTYIFTLVVNDGTFNSPIDKIRLHVKKLPGANAGVDQIVYEGTSITIDGSLSFDPYRNPLTYKWTPKSSKINEDIPVSKETIIKYDNNGLETKLIEAKEGTKVFLTFSASDNKNHIFKFTDKVLESIFVMFDISTGDISTLFLPPPVGIYEYSVDDIEKGTMIVESFLLSSAFISKPIFMAPEVQKDTTFIFNLVVNNGKVDSPISQVKITVKNINIAPKVNAGIDQMINEGATVSLNGSLSSDPDGNTLTYKWTAPVGITLSSVTAAMPTFTAPEVTQDTPYAFTLVVNDGTVDSNISSVIIYVQNVITDGVSTIVTPLFKIYPNPTTGMVTIEFVQDTNEKSEVCVSNMVGAEVFRKEIIDVSKFQIDLSHQVSGIYMLKIVRGTQQAISKIIMSKE